MHLLSEQPTHKHKKAPHTKTQVNAEVHPFFNPTLTAVQSNDFYPSSLTVISSFLLPAWPVSYPAYEISDLTLVILMDAYAAALPLYHTERKMWLQISDISPYITCFSLWQSFYPVYVNEDDYLHRHLSITLQLTIR